MVMEVQVNRIGNQNARFWTRPDIEAVRRLVDIWASQVMHSETVLVPVHKVDFVGKRIMPVPTGKKYPLEGDLSAIHRDAVTEAPFPLSRTSLPAIGQQGMRTEMQVKMMIHAAIGNDHVLAGLLLWLYPRSGPYESSRGIETFRPASWVAEMRENFTGKSKHFEQHLDRELGRLHRNFLMSLLGHLKA